MSKKTSIEVKNDIPIPCKIILVGESGVGKTSIISRYLEQYQEKTESTLGAYFSNKIVNIDGYQINFEIWDTAGQEQYRSITSLFYKDAYICLLVYDITHISTFNSIKEYWHKAIVDNGLQGVILGVVGNKNDLYENEEVSEKEGEDFSKSINACFKLTSAKVNTSIDDIFKMVGKKFIESDFLKKLLPKYINNYNTAPKNETIKISQEELKEGNDKNEQKKKNKWC